MTLPLSASCATTEQSTSDLSNTDMVRIEAGSYTALYKQQGVADVIAVEPFYLDKFQVSNQQFVDFTLRADKWSKANIKPIFADASYLQQLRSQTVEGIANQPVVNVSWFAATAYCKSLGKRLPTLDEWEYTAQASATEYDGSSSVEFREKILQWYSKPTSDVLADVRDGEANHWGVHGMHGVVWELVRDFNTSLVTGESRGDSALDKQLFCGAGATSSVDPSDYAAFMRYALRSSYSSSYTLSSLGFRCAKDL